MNRLLISAVCAVACTSVVLHAQSIKPVSVIPRAQQLCIVSEFQSPDSVVFGATIARLAAVSIAKSLEGKNPVRFAPLPGREHDEAITVDSLSRLAQNAHAVFLISGDYFVDAERVVVYPRLTCIPASGVNDSTFGLDYTSELGDLKARPAATELTFQPLSLPLAVLNAAGDLTMHADAGASSASTGTLDERRSYTIETRQGEWVRIAAEGGTTGWLHALPPGSEESLAAFNPVGNLLAAMAQYVAGEYRESDATLTQWLNSTRPNEDRMSVMFAYLLSGTTRVRMLPNPMVFPPNENIVTEYKAALNVAPENSSPIDFLTIARLIKYVGPSKDIDLGRTPDLVESEDLMVQNIRQNWNELSIQNLQTFYQLAGQHHFLKTKEVEDTLYTQRLNAQLGTLTETQEQIRPGSGRVIIILSGNRSPSPGTTSFRLGIWTPKDKELAFHNPDNNYAYKESKIELTKTYGVDFHIRNRIIHPVYFDFSFSGWFSKYHFTNTAEVPDSQQVITLNSWALVLPITAGASVTLMPDNPIHPYLTAGIGAYVAFESRSYTTETFKFKTDDTNVLFAFGFYTGAGVDILLSRSFGFSIGVKYQMVKFKEPLFSGQQDWTGLQLLGGIVTNL